jgi:hypothetical protein
VVARAGRAYAPGVLIERDAPAPRTCAYCRAELGADAVVTCRCGVALHRECLRDNRGACTSVGCPGVGHEAGAAPGAEAPAAIGPGPLARVQSAPPRWAGAAALAVVALLALAVRLFAPLEASTWAASLLLVPLAPLLAVVAARDRLASPRGAAALTLGLAGLALFARDPHELRSPPDAGFDLYLHGPLVALLVAAGAALAARRLQRPGEGAKGPAVSLAGSVLAGALLAGGAALGAWRAAGESDPGVRTTWLAQWLIDLRWDAALQQGGRGQVAQAVGSYTSRDDATRWALERAKLRLDRASLNRWLLELLADADPYVRHAAAGFLGANRARDPAAVPALVAALADQDGAVRMSACWALRGYAQDLPEAVRPHAAALRAATRDPDGWARLNAVHALGALRDLEAIPHLIERLGDDRGPTPGNWEHVDEAAAEALLALGPPAAAAVRAAALGDPSPAVREAAARLHAAMIERLGAKAGPPLPE